MPPSYADVKQIIKFADFSADNTKKIRHVT